MISTSGSISTVTDTTLNDMRDKDYEIVARGNRQFTVTRIKDREDSHSVMILPTKKLVCDCKAALQYKQTCHHQRAVLLEFWAISGNLDLKAEVPTPIDVAQLESEALNAYLMRLNRAHNLFIVEVMRALRILQQASTEFKKKRSLRKQIEKMKGEAKDVVEAMKHEDIAEEEKDKAQLEMDILKAQIDEIRNASIKTLSALKSIRP